MRMSKGVKDHLLHFNDGFSLEIMDYATNVALKSSKYIFVTKIKKQQYGYCTHCNTEFPTHLPMPTDRAIAEREMCGCSAAMYMDEEYYSKKHGDRFQCPNCSSIGIVRYAGLGHSRLRDYAFFVYYEKSRLDPRMIVARGIHAKRDYGVSYKNVKTQLTAEVFYTFEYKNIGRMIKEICESWNAGYHLGFSKTVHTWESRHPYTTFCYSRDSIKKAVKDTPFAWSGWEAIDHKDMVDFFDLYSRYPVTEYLLKHGYKSIVHEKLERGSVSYGSINWQGKTIESVLRLTKEEYRTIKQNKLDVNSFFLHLIQHCKERLLGISIQEMSQLSSLTNGLGEIDNLISSFGRYMNFREALKYCVKQSQKSKTLNSLYIILSDWRDYVSECKKLNMDITDTRVLFPNDLMKAHLNTTSQIRYSEDKALTEKIEARLPDLANFYYQSAQYSIRPAESSFEIVEEGKLLGHCVGRYAKDHADGKTCILFIRKMEEPEKPFYTVEVTDNKIVQVRGFKNHTPEDDDMPLVSDFVEQFKKHAFSKKTLKNRIKVNVPA